MSAVTRLRTCPTFTSERPRREPRRVQHDGQEPPEAHMSQAVDWLAVCHRQTRVGWPGRSVTELRVRQPEEVD